MDNLIEASVRAAPTVALLLALGASLGFGVSGSRFWLGLIAGWALFVLAFVLLDITAPAIPPEYGLKPMMTTKAAAIAGWFPVCCLYLVGRLARRFSRLVERNCNRNRFVLVFAVTSALLWWPGVRIYYYVWVSVTGDLPARQADFSQLPNVLPPEEAILATVYHGLPHQMYEPGKLFLELFLTRSREIGGYRFHTSPAMIPNDMRDRIHRTLRQPDLYRPYGGPKLCGGYHPDYCIEWQDSNGPSYGLLCMGCGEIRFVRKGATVHCDLRNDLPIEIVDLLKQLRAQAED